MIPYRSILVTGGAGFIGVNFIHHLLKNKEFTGTIVNLDSLTYAGNLMSLKDVGSEYPERYSFHHGDITDSGFVRKILRENNIDCIVHFAAESHVDRSIHGPADFIQSNIMGTFTLLEAARVFWKTRDDVRFHHISTDEVFGSLSLDGGFFTETTAYDPRSPYSASKASSDHLVKAYYHTYGLPISISNCSNNYGPYQFPEKLIPLMIMNMMNGKNLPIYGEGRNVRDWLYVEDHVIAISTILRSENIGETYVIGGENEWTNLDLVKLLCNLVAEKMGTPVDSLLKLISFVKDRPGHDMRYAMDCSYIRSELGWSQKTNFEQGIKKTINWYFENDYWCQSVISGEYRQWIHENYQNRDE